MLPAAGADNGDADQCRLLLVMEFGYEMAIPNTCVVVIVDAEEVMHRERQK